MAKFKGAIVIDIEKCKGCGLCVEVCPQNVIALGNNVNTKGYFYADVIKEDCTACENCVMVCPDTVITLYKAKVEV
ncbi:MAG TPA: ferredoxin family protein [Bacteroidales bacterium]|jgi:2-oxoglutarate ferredoxin oxidoreductase subunit delta|nr:4Fe-4S binding protein [Bacteroidales bacterium]OQC46012.1 MAG: Ferredoxin-2 [Bacteroidetes bacterium ADurb.Bin035]MBP8946227.1 4Fe-4S binding protein [Bacteroidales bacterium]HNQ19749.1 ferredoxin family protein [Bacteroidales bacterium]HNT70266.1 ferredoxin family protein [Bacteroidales bacterium]